MKVSVKQWPTRQEEAVARLDTDAYAFVNNDNPKDRLHLREKPDRKAKSLGKFYNRTPVQILSWDGDWAHVRIGAGDANLEGYMMTRYLVRGGGNRDVSCAFETLMAVDTLGDGARSTAYRMTPWRRLGGFLAIMSSAYTETTG